MTRPYSLCLSVIVLASTVQAVVREVPGDHATIQAAISAASDGDVIMVSPGEYNENINFSGKDITLTSLDPNDPNTVATTILTRKVRDQRTAGTIVSFMSGESAAAVLTGFTIQGGYGTEIENNQFFGGGILCLGASPTVIKNVVTENQSAMSINGGTQGIGGGICCLESGAFVAYNTVYGNAAAIGGGIVAAGGDAIVFNNLVYDNDSAVGGGGAVFGAYLLNNTFVANTASEIGGSLYTASGGDFGQSLVENNIFGFSPQNAGVYVEVDQNTDWFAHNNVFGNSPFNYFIQGQDPGVDTKTGQFGNISANPLFVNGPRGDYRLSDESPCIDAGTPDFDPQIGPYDFVGAMRLGGGAVDIGAFESTLCSQPVANAGPDQEAAPGAVVTLDASATLFCDPNTQRLFLWDQSSGPSVELDDPRSPTPSFVAGPEAEYRFELIVFDGLKVSRPDEVLITVRAPTRGQ